MVFDEGMDEPMITTEEEMDGGEEEIAGDDEFTESE